MEKNSPDRAVKICNVFLKFSIYLLTFLLPIFFLPWTANVLDFNKQTLLVLLVLISLFCWILRTLISGKIVFTISPVYIPVGVLALAFLLSSLFSFWPYGSFWGWPLPPGEGLLTLLFLAIFFFLLANNFTKREVLYLSLLAAFSGFLATLFGIFQIWGKFLVPFPFAKVSSFNTIGTLNNLAVFSAVVFPLFAVLLIRTRKILRIILAVAVLATAFLMVLVNSSVVWQLTILASVLLIIFGIQKREIFRGRWVILPMLFLALALFFVFFKFKTPGLPDRPVEIFLSHKASFETAKEVLKERPLFGSGLGTFSYDFSKYKDKALNETPFWNIRFESARSKILNSLSTTGVIGFAAALFLAIFPIFWGLKVLLTGKEKIEFSVAEKKENSRQDTKGTEDEGESLLAIGAFISVFVLSCSFFLYFSNLTLDFMYFFFLACFVVLVSPAKKEFLLKPSSLSSLGITFASILVFIFSFGLMILEGKRYLSEINYLSGLKEIQQKNSEGAIKRLEKSAILSPDIDLYWRDLAEVYLQKANEDVGTLNMSEGQSKQQIQTLIKNTVNSAKKATDVNPKNVANWTVRASIYQRLIKIVPDSEEWAVKSYDEAISLEPINPFFPFQKGMVSLRQTDFLQQDNSEQINKFVAEAKNQFNKALELKSDYSPARFQLAVIYYKDKDYPAAQSEFEKIVLQEPNYSNALYFLGLVYDRTGEKQKAVEMFNRVLALNPDNSEVQKILENLNSGKSALDGIVSDLPSENLQEPENLPEKLEK